MHTEPKEACDGSIARAFVVGTLALATSAFGAWPPYAATQPAAPVRATSATLNGMATPRGDAATAWFEWGPDRNYGYTTSPVDAGSGQSVVRVSAQVEDLITGGVYHYRLVSSNSIGVTFGADQAFTTGMKYAEWGYQFAFRSPPEGLTNLVSIASGHGHALCLRNDGTVVCWAPQGVPYESVTNVPPGLSNVVAVAGGWFHSLALLENGTVIAWGLYEEPSERPAYVPAGLTNVIAIAGGDSHSLALKADGTVVAWGDSSHGQTSKPPGLTNVVAISAGSTHSIALKADGRVVSWGLEYFGNQTPPASLSNVVAIATETWHNLALRSDGTAAAWGETSANKCVVPPGLTNVVAVAAGYEHSLALMLDGTVTVWGDTQYLNCVPADLREAVAIASGDYYSHALTPANLRPYARSRSASGVPNRDVLIQLAGGDPNGDRLSFLVSSGPTNGTLYQFTETGRGSPIGAPGVPVTDSGARLFYAPAPDALGAPFDAFSFLAADGTTNSPPGWETINVVTQPVISYFGPTATNPAVHALRFSGFPAASYQVQVSTDLTNWGVVNSAGQVSPGQFEFIESLLSGPPPRFYRVRLP